MSDIYSSFSEHIYRIEESPRNTKRLLVSLLFILFGYLWCSPLLAHERWILTPEQIAEWNAKPKPELYTSVSLFNGTLISVFLLFTIGWIRLGFTGARELFPDLQARLGSYGDIVAPILRFCLAWVLISSTFGLEPRYGVEMFSSPTLFAPDLELKSLPPGWLDLRWVQFSLGLGFLFGIYVRCCAAALLLLGLLSVPLFGAAVFAYAGALIGVAIYLLLQGPGSFFVPMPTEPRLLKWQEWLASQPRQRAQAIMRVLTGITIFYLAVVYKVFQPNLTLGILSIHNVFLLSSAPEEFTLLMALVEFTSGILIIAGILLRPLSLFFLFAFLFFAALLPESWMAHALFYGVMLSFLFNGAGHFHMPEAHDKAANIVVVGGTIAAIHAAMKIEKLVGQYTRVKLTLVNDQPNVLFYPLLPEVIGGTMQPGNAVNPIRRVLPQTRVVLGELAHIDTRSKTVVIRHDVEKILDLPYDELILALSPVPKLVGIPGLMAHSNPINSIGDALFIRKRIMDQVEEAELEEDPAVRDRLLTFAVIGSGQRACATAVEICQILNTARVSYPVLRQYGWHVHLYEETNPPVFEDDIRVRRDAELKKAGVHLFNNKEVAAVTAENLVFKDGERQPVSLVVNASFMLPSIRIDQHVYRWPLEINDDLSFRNDPHIWVTAMPEQSQNRSYLSTSDWVRLGKAVGQNTWASSQNFATKPFKPKKHWLLSFNMGRRSLCKIGPVMFGGFPAWIISRITNLAVLPGLERNLRILIDWFLDIPFRADIAVLTPDLTQKLQRLHYETGDEVIRQGESGDTAYVIQSGHLEVLRDGHKIDELSDGDYFGEIALLQNTVRAATVKCLTPCELTVLTRDDFQTLSIGSSTMARAIRKQMDERISTHNTV